MHQQKGDRIHSLVLFSFIAILRPSVVLIVFVANGHESDLFNTIMCYEILFSIFSSFDQC